MQDRMKGLPLSLFAGLCAALVAGCAPIPGPDKQFSRTVTGAASGAGMGAVTGFQVGAGAGPGAAVGAGFGAIAGGIQGALLDQTEQTMLQQAAGLREERQRAVVHEVLEEHYKRRLEIHPTRDIYPADLFFFGDESQLRPQAKVLAEELARLNKNRLPWSRIAVAVYSRANDENSIFAHRLAERRAQEICNYFVRAGLEPRRLEARGVVITEPLLIDPDDRPERYNQAVEIIPLDR